MGMIVSPYRFATAGGVSGTPTNIAWLGSLPTVGAANGGAVTLTFSNFRNASNVAITLQQDDVIVVAGEQSFQADVAMATTSTGWTKDADIYQAGSGAHTNLGVWHKVMGAVPDTSFVLTGTGGSIAACVGTAMVFRGVDTTTPLDGAVVTGSGTATSNPNPPSITPTAAGSTIVVVGGGGGGSSLYTQPGDLSSSTNHFRAGTGVDSTIANVGMGFTNSWTGTFDPAQWTGATANVGDSWTAIVLALRST